MLTASQKGNIIESQIANMITLLSNGEISASIPIVDDFGIDLLLTKKGRYKTIYLQIKSRFSHKNLRCDFDIRKVNFVPDKNMYVLCVFFDRPNNDINTIWLIPSEFVNEHSVSTGTHRIPASINPDSSDKWSKYKLGPMELVDKLVQLL